MDIEHEVRDSSAPRSGHLCGSYLKPKKEGGGGGEGSAHSLTLHRHGHFQLDTLQQDSRDNSSTLTTLLDATHRLGEVEVRNCPS